MLLRSDCWPLRQRNAAGEIVPDPAKFPDGMGAFSNQLKQKGVGLGIYTAHGNLTCQVRSRTLVNASIK